MPKETTTFETISSILTGNPELALAFQELIKVERHPKHHLLHQAGMVCNSFFILKEGISRVYYYKDGKDITCWFSFQDEVFTAIDSFFQQKKSKYNIELLEDSIVWSVCRTNMELLLEKHPAFERIMRLFFQVAYVELVERMDSMQFHSAIERYELLLEKKPSVLQSVPLGHVASFLGMTQETLSRVRAKRI